MLITLLEDDYKIRVGSKVEIIDHANGIDFEFRGTIKYYEKKHIIINWGKSNRHNVLFRLNFQFFNILNCSIGHDINI